MVKGLVLYVDGTSKVIDLKDVFEYQKVVGGLVELMPTRYSYITDGKKSNIVCYVNEEGYLEGLPENKKWEPASRKLGFGKIMGNAILFTEGKGGDEADIDEYIIEFVHKYNRYRDPRS